MIITRGMVIGGLAPEVRLHDCVMRRASGGTEIHRTSISNNIELSGYVIAKMREEIK